ncbi:WcaI family glycosyltransferase [Spirosoma sordidisoli]|uniref:Colanic acid biosynthesis glycosyltransferase WcaI n=1 Tax=Spirosoma sordidisoli TaxID=2502893 RepID=A0A4Q2UGS1_9BACT|nr:WcaI family glycosyltransferase [Spirosoma sordidisoli]RYC68547.1 colanic acid biosynthesis glycosyltransferase WcaI [Spirosoma sordidisoli]
MKKLKLLFYAANFTPELTGSGKYNGELVDWLAQRGHSIDVITTHPHYPKWKIDPAYRGKLWTVDKLNNVTIYRCPLYVPMNPSGFKRILHEISFAVSSFPVWLKVFFSNYDAVVCVSPPMFIGLLPYLYGKLKHIPYLFHIQDLQVDAARTLGLIKNERLLYLLGNIEKFLLKKATVVSSIGLGMRHMILSKGVQSNKFFMLPNWVDTKFIRPLNKHESFRSLYGFQPSDLVIMYAGNLGAKQGLEILLDVAEILISNKSIKFLINGEGAIKQMLLVDSHKRKLSNVFFGPGVPYEDLPRLMSTADIHVVIQKRGMTNIVMPSKLTTILASGGVTIVTAEESSLLAQQLISDNVALIVQPESAVLLAQAILDLAISDNLVKLKENARRYAVLMLNKDTLLLPYEKKIMSVSKRK